MAMLGHISSHVSSDSSLLLMSLLLLLPLTYGENISVLDMEEQNNQLTDELPVTYRQNVELLDTVLALDKNWSPIWSEKLKPNVVTQANLVKQFCPPLSDFGDTVNTLHVIKSVKEHCSYSGMYVSFAVKLLSHSVQCMFNRHTIAQLTAISRINNDSPINEFDKHLEHLVSDYHLIADRLALVGVDLTNLIKLAKFYDSTRKQLVQYVKPKTVIGKENKSTFIKRISRDVTSMIDLLETELETYCAVSSTNWYDLENQKSMSLNVETTDGDEGNPSSSTQPDGDIPKDKIVKKANQLRLILRNVFDNLLLEKMPLEVWSLIFENNILIKPIPPKEKSFKLF
ncbi:uncharacterized protein LOC112590918 [Melanaphis sacchari]|uniref:uncharacterized protein LOC112590918 n=1 Tax=Melanaphis sacchari TaxID=742174 RepID=UPI000DC15401|nr:uncharacterized protein LOC112590918 [Melanaphis sacchari]